MLTALYLSLSLSLAAPPMPEIIAHRGESGDAPENTLAAFRLAWERGVDAVELDVHLTKDDRLLVCHDADLKRTGGVEITIKESEWSELQGIDVGRWKDPKFAGECLSLIDEALPLIPDGARCFIEVKVGPESVPALVRAVRAANKSPEQLPVISFKSETIAEVKKQLPQHKAYWLVSFKQDEQSGRWSPSLDEVLKTAKEIGADGLDLSWKGPWDDEFVKRIRDAQLELYVWTVDDPQVARRFMQYGVDGITTNNAAFMRDQLKSAVPPAASN